MNRKVLRRKLLAWFKKNQRDYYPWRNTKNPYFILIAEIFLQRTKADQVEPVYRKFIKLFPSPNILAHANLENIMEIVYPLGLKWRAKNLQKTAADILSKFDGNIPSDKEKLLKIKGVGEYIADSIRYQAFGIRTSIIDSNVVRIIGRLHGLKINPESRRDKKFRDIANELLPPIAFKKFNLALLDLGALVCTPCPQCKICPLKSHCEYYIKKQGK